MPLDIAARTGNLRMMQMLADAFKAANKANKAPRAEKPACMLQTVGTGNYNQRTFGMRRVR